MGASVTVYWPGMTERQWETQPGFRNDDRAWGNWMAERDGDSAVLEAVQRLQADAILTLKTDGWGDEDVTWVTPRELREAAARLRDAVQVGAPEIRTILASYERNANRLDPVAEEFVRDLDDIDAMTRWAEAEGAAAMTLEVNW
jgi:hypothetical protein